MFAPPPLYIGGLMQVLHSLDLTETKRAALFYLMDRFCNDVGFSAPLSSFARFCTVTTSTEDLIAAIELASADLTDCKSWGISPEEWHFGLRQALYQQIVEALLSESNDFDISDSPAYGTPGTC